jgi:hypothetical protein
MDVTRQFNPANEAVVQTQTGPVGAADVNIAGGAATLDNSDPGQTNAVVTTPANGLGTGTLNATTTAAAASLVVKAGPGKVYRITVYNAKGSAQFIQIHDAVSLPAESAIPKVSAVVATVANLVLDFGPYGRTFSTGIVVCNSSTVAAKTIGSADCWIDVQYL